MFSINGFSLTNIIKLFFSRFIDTSLKKLVSYKFFSMILILFSFNFSPASTLINILIVSSAILSLPLISILLIISAKILEMDKSKIKNALEKRLKGFFNIL